MKLTVSIANEFLRYNSRTGQLTWRSRKKQWFPNDQSWRTWNSRFAGKLALASYTKGYLVGTILGKRYASHRVIWFLKTGRWPQVIDHKNHNGCDNRWDNLRSVDSQINSRNRVSKTDGCIGVRFHRTYRVYEAYIGLNGQGISLGSFSSFTAAVKARKTAEKNLWRNRQ